MIQRREKEKHLHQHLLAVWIYGLSGSGKTTIAIELEKKLIKKGFFCVLLDADNIRATLNHDLGFSIDDRTENIRRIAEINKIFLYSGIITINCFICPTSNMRTLARTIIGVNDFVEVFLSTPLEVCDKRDPKGLYKKAKKGEVPSFTGISSPFEIPENPDITIAADQLNVEDCTSKILNFILPKLKN